jgi:hypothetical protein
MQSSHELAVHSSHRVLHKVEHYFELYDRYFSKYRNKPVRVLEVGIYKGGSLDLWRKFFGEEATLFGVDIDPQTRNIVDKSVKVIICDQEDRDGLLEIFSKLPPFDIIIDDGGHSMLQQIRTFEALFPLLAKDGIYLVEDTQTSYWKPFNGGLRREGTFIEYAKQLIDYVNKDHFVDTDMLELYPAVKQSAINELNGIYFHDGMCFFQKGDKTTKKQFFYHGDGIIVDAGPVIQYA